MAGKAKDLSGWITESGVTVIQRVANKGNKPQWLCKCFCGKEFITRSDSLKSGHTKSCGCLQKKKARDNIITYNKSIALDLYGFKVGKLTALEPTDQKCGSSIKWKCKCECGNICYVSSSHLVSKNPTMSCGCLRSKGEAKISKILQAANIDFITQYSKHSCIFDSGRPARFDFYVNNQYIIEYDGNVHYQITSPNSWGNEENLTRVKKYDKIKTEWCKNNNIPLIRIPYTHYNELCLEDLLLETSQFIVKGDHNNESK